MKKKPSTSHIDQQVAIVKREILSLGYQKLCCLASHESTQKKLKYGLVTLEREINIVNNDGLLIMISCTTTPKESDYSDVPYTALRAAIVYPDESIVESGEEINLRLQEAFEKR